MSSHQTLNTQLGRSRCHLLEWMVLHEMYTMPCKLQLGQRSIFCSMTLPSTHVATGVKGRASPPPPRESYHANPSNSKNAREALAAPTPMRHDLEGADAERHVASRSVSPPPSASPMDGGGAAAGVAVVEKSGREDRLSDLPDDLVCKMLRFLDIDSVVHCGMLSTRWPGLLDEKVRGPSPVW